MTAQDTPAEVWCAKCDQPSERVINDEALCHEHALEAEWKQNSPSWAGGFAK